jgi:acyl-CoA thioesterase-1
MTSGTTTARWRLVVVAMIVLLAAACGEEPFRRPTAGTRIICFGDSLTYGTGASDGMSYPSQLSRLIGIEVVNAGIPGDTTGDGLNRLEDYVLSQSPRLVLITLGGNDLKNGTAKETAFANLKQIVERIHDAGAVAVIGGIHIPLYGRGYGAAYKELAKETGAVLIDNILEGIMGNHALMSDPIHPNDAGYAIMAERFQKAIRPLL